MPCLTQGFYQCAATPILILTDYSSDTVQGWGPAEFLHLLWSTKNGNHCAITPNTTKKSSGSMENRLKEMAGNPIRQTENNIIILSSGRNNVILMSVGDEIMSANCVFTLHSVCLTKSFVCSAGNLQTMTLEYLLFSAHKEVCVKPDCQRWKWCGERWLANKLYLDYSIREKTDYIFNFKMPCVKQCENALWNTFDKPPPKILYNNKQKEKRKHRQTHTHAQQCKHRHIKHKPIKKQHNV